MVKATKPAAGRPRAATVLLGTGILTRVRKLAQSTRRRVGAVAYVAEGGASVLPFRRDDVLVVDMSERAVRSGSTNPSEVEKLYKKGVRRTRKPLHVRRSSSRPRSGARGG